MSTATPHPTTGGAPAPAGQDGSLGATLLDAGTTALHWLGAAAAWIGANSFWLIPLAVLLTIGAAVVHHRLTARALADRTRYVLTPSTRFDPTSEELHRYATTLLRVAKAGPWWAPGAGRSARIRLRADGTVPLEFSVEGPAAAEHLMKITQYQEVTVTKAPLPKDTEREHVVRAEFVLRGHAARALRNVPMDPDPLQGLVDAVADLSTKAGDLAEICLDIQAVPRLRLLLKRFQMVNEAREQRRKENKKEARRAAADAAELEDSWRHQLTQLLEPGQQSVRRSAPPAPRGRGVDRAQVLGRLGGSRRNLVRVQLLVRVASDKKDRAELRLARLAAALDVFGEGNVWSEDASAFAKWRVTANSRGRRKAFDQRWASARTRPRKENWVGIGELNGLLKPVTAHCRLPVLASEVPTYDEIGSELVPHGILHSPDGRSRLAASPEEEFLFSVTVGRAGFGKTEKAEVQALALAAAGRSVFFIDPHGDSWSKVRDYLAHDSLRTRVCHLDLTGRGGMSGLVPTWNPLGMEHGQVAHEVVRAFVDGMAASMAWDDSKTPRGLTLLMKSCEALVTYNAAVVKVKALGAKATAEQVAKAQALAKSNARAQATIFQIPNLLEDSFFRDWIISHLPEQQARWWRTTFTTIDPSAYGVIINPITRLAAQPVSRAFLGSPVSGYNARKAMDARKLVWVCPAGTGPTDKLLLALLFQDLFRAGRSRENLAEDKRRPVHIFADELISLDKAVGGVLADIAEQLRKFGIRLHVMTQLLQRLSQTTRDSLLQNASALSSTAGSQGAIRIVADEWHGKVDPVLMAELPRYHYYATMTVGGQQVGPLRLEGMQVKHVFKDLRAREHVAALSASAARAAGGRTRTVLLRRADYHQGVVAYFAQHGKMPAGDALKAIQEAATAKTPPEDTKPGGTEGDGQQATGVDLSKNGQAPAAAPGQSAQPAPPPSPAPSTEPDPGPDPDEGTTGTHSSRLG
ncbi:ATP/GTP-binding protein [Kitasatospora sp. NPDC088548]|uniref:ATP/GTP-binding protein n=1 Tax=Kitasatospora sp. NPDC088548 TaxID=3364075 RepID=UPI0037F67191